MTKQPVKPVYPTDFNDQTTVKADAKDRDLVTVKYTGPGQAVLGTRFILHDEVRANVSRGDLAKAEAEHEGEFEIVAQPAVTTDETATPLDTANFEAGVVPNPQALPYSMEPGGTSTIPASPQLDPMLPVKPEKAAEKAPEKASKK